MNKEIKEKWIKALLSDEYKQGTGKLCYTAFDGIQKYCCLGVLCDLAVKEGVIPEPNKQERYGFCSIESIYIFDGECTGLPSKVQDWAEIDSIIGRFQNDEYENLSNKNDRGASFKEIAEIIEKEF